jgi:hypothetical protein
MGAMTHIIIALKMAILRMSRIKWSPVTVTNIICGERGSLYDGTD